LSYILCSADAAQELFTTSPSIAKPKALKNAGLSIGDVDYFEFNEAFCCCGISQFKNTRNR
jgi:acetyl-CoA C-acetyltransferase